MSEAEVIQDAKPQQETKWYVIRVVSGKERKVKEYLDKEVKINNWVNSVVQILCPIEKVFKVVNGKKVLREKTLFPGYILIEMNMKPETHRLVSGSLRVLKFLGGKDPVPLSRKEIDRILSQMKGEIAVGVEKQELFTIGSEIEISDGPFASFVGVVDSVDMENEKLTVMVSIFGRMTPVELGFNQVKR